MRPTRLWLIGVLFVFATVSAPVPAAAQRGGAFPFSRFELLVDQFKLEGDQKKAVKALLDQAGKDAEPTREALLATHAALGEAVQGGKSQADIDAAAQAYATQAAAMARIEMEAIAKVLRIADPELKNTQGIQSAFFMARGMFLKKKWDEIPDPNVPSY